MHRESFMDPVVAKRVNALVVPVLVDREERPDIDALYQDAATRMGVQRGWPLTLFLDAEGRPFAGGAYFPDQPRAGMPSFAQLLETTALAWQGFAQNLSQREMICLHGLKKATLPEWFVERFPARYQASRIFDEALPEEEGLVKLPEAPDGPLVSTPERALLEMLSEVGVHQEADEARGIMESLRSLRMKELGELLRHCRKVKAARLCVVWAEELGLPWAGAAREAAAGRLGQGRWIRRLKDGSLLVVKS
jgi:uncharacterized protein YyaL (SSP411 family)